MKTLTCLTLLMFLSIISIRSYSQIIDIDYTPKSSPSSLIGPHTMARIPHQDTMSAPQLLKSGFVNYLTNGSIQASANLLRINIGEQNGFYIPFFIYTGTSGGGFGDTKGSETTIANLLNPIAGTLNFSFNGRQNVIKGDNYTSLKFAYQLGGRVVNGKDSTAQTNFNFFNGYGNAGLFFQTQAWTPSDPKNIGVAFLHAGVISAISSKDNYQKILGDHNFSSSYLIGYSVDGGIEINQVIDLKFGVYQFTNSANALLNKPIVNFSINYSFSKN